MSAYRGLAIAWHEATGEADSQRAAGAQELFREKHYVDLDGGILEGFGRLLKFDLKLYVYPTLDDSTGELMTADNIKVRVGSGLHLRDRAWPVG